ncbi:MAG: glucose 1-dehydrogenase [Dehalococcoidia bacterium]|nr:glucose 1-dehydrogenase [Dehalococcoidia bacterium]
MESDSNLEGKVAIVTGGGRGVGQGIATVFARSGADVVIAEKDADLAEDTRELVEKQGRRALVVQTDVTDEDSVDAMLARALATFKHVDVLVNNVGGVARPRMIALDEMELDEWRYTMDLNLTSQFLCSRALIRHWLGVGRPGSIVNISSLAAMVPYKTSVAYGAAKAGVINMTQTVGSQYGKNGIRVNCIAPGHVKTPITDALYKGREDVRAAQDRIIPLGRYGNPEEFGKVAAFLASDASSYITGQTILVSGGMHYFLTELP